MPIHDALGDRMKEYESRNQYFLQRRTPVIIRVDMRAGHTFTKGFQRPFDKIFGNSMVKTMEYCAENIGNCIFAYCQSDEITFVLSDYRKLNTDAWFSYRTDKLCSIAASMATMAFNRFFRDEVEDYCINKYINCCGFKDVKQVYSLEELKTVDSVLYAYNTAMESGAMFDARCFNIPKEEVCNCIYWRQLDAMRNSVQMVGQANFSHKELQGKSCNDIQNMLVEKKDICWLDFPTRWRHGVAWSKSKGLDYEMPILRDKDREYVDHEVYFVEEV